MGSNQLNFLPSLEECPRGFGHLKCLLGGPVLMQDQTTDGPKKRTSTNWAVHGPGRMME